MGKPEDQLNERKQAVNDLVLAYLEKQRVEEAFVTVHQGAGTETMEALLNGIFAAGDSETGGTTGKIKMALEVASLGVSDGAIQSFAEQIIIEDWLKSEATRSVFSTSKENMSVTVTSVIEAVIKIHISSGHLLSAQEAAKLLGRELSVDEINLMIERHCRDGKIRDVLDVIRTTKTRKLTLEEIKMLTEAVYKQ